jgi:hypothetical protein
VIYIYFERLSGLLHRSTAVTSHAQSALGQPAAGE